MTLDVADAVLAERVLGPDALTYLFDCFSRCSMAQEVADAVRATPAARAVAGPRD